MPQLTEPTTEREIDPQLEARFQFLNERKLPAVITANPGESLPALLTGSRASLTAIKRKYGAILFRGFNITTAEDFRSTANLAFENELKDYVGGVSPRGQVMSGVYESTRFPAHLRISTAQRDGLPARPRRANSPSFAKSSRSTLGKHRWPTRAPSTSSCQRKFAKPSRLTASPTIAISTARACHSTIATAIASPNCTHPGWQLSQPKTQPWSSEPARRTTAAWHGTRKKER